MGYYIDKNVVVVTKHISVYALKMFKQMGYIIKFIC
jgi:hypothetical protein